MGRTRERMSERKRESVLERVSKICKSTYLHIYEY